MKKLKLKPARHDSREILTVNGSKVQSMPIFDTSIVSLDRNACEEIGLTGSRLADFTTVRRPDMNPLKLKYSHTQDKRFYMTSGGEYQIDLILGDSMYSRIRTERVFKGNPGEPLEEETTFGWVVHGGDEYASDHGVCMYLREVMIMRNCTVWMCLELKIGGRMSSLMYCVTLTRTLREETMGGMKSVSPGFQELSYRAQTRC